MPTPEEIAAAEAAKIETPTEEVITEDVTIETDENITDEDETDPEADKAKNTDEDEETEEEFSVSLTDDEEEEDLHEDPEAEDAPAKSKDSTVIRDMRKRLKRLEREKKALERQQQAADAATTLPELGEKPKLEDFDFDEEKFEPALADYLEKKRVHDAAAKEAKEKSEAIQTAHENRLKAYATRKAEIAETREDIADAEDAVKDALNVTMQGVFMTVADDPAVLILALGKYPKRLEKLAAITDPLILAKEVVKLEGSLNVKGKSSKPQPEKRAKRPVGAAPNLSDTKLKQLEAKADKTGDRTELQRYKRELAKAKQ